MAQVRLAVDLVVADGVAVPSPEKPDSSLAWVQLTAVAEAGSESAPQVLGAVELLDILGPRPHGGDYIDIAAETAKAAAAKAAEAAAKNEAETAAKEDAEAEAAEIPKKEVAESSGDGVSSEQDPAIDDATEGEEELSDSKSK